MLPVPFNYEVNLQHACVLNSSMRMLKELRYHSWLYIVVFQCSQCIRGGDCTIALCGQAACRKAIMAVPMSMEGAAPM